MITAKEESEKIFNTFRNRILSFLSDKQKNENAKKCSIILIQYNLKKYEDEFKQAKKNYAYWKNVKYELENSEL